VVPPIRNKEKPKQSIAELRAQIEKILKDTHTPGLSIAIGHRDGPEWVTGLGLADVASNQPTTADTLFPIESTSKAFAALSILMLADQGKLSLDDSVHKLAPEVWFENRWEVTDPMQVVNLLEHTTGLDDMHLREYAKDAPPTMSVREGLDCDHHSRAARWPPGNRMDYCNSGPPIAAYIVEKITGQRFENFADQNLFRPIGMKTATYLPPAPGSATTLYHTAGRLHIVTGTFSCVPRDRSTHRPTIWPLIFRSISIVERRAAGSRLCLHLTLTEWTTRKAPGWQKRE
jgi:CubicO group peptidase (beta-lactamase class C family)